MTEVCEHPPESRVIVWALIKGAICTECDACKAILQVGPIPEDVPFQEINFVPLRYGGSPAQVLADLRVPETLKWMEDLVFRSLGVPKRFIK